MDRVTSDEKCYVESMRIYELLKSISDKGYVRKNSLDGDIRAHLLYDTDSQWCWQAVGGQHRACAQASFKCKSVMVKIQMMIRRSESKHWPNVVNGLYTEDEALDIFDKILNCYIPQFVNTI